MKTSLLTILLLTTSISYAYALNYKKMDRDDDLCNLAQVSPTQAPAAGYGYHDYCYPPQAQGGYYKTPTTTYPSYEDPYAAAPYTAAAAPYSAAAAPYTAAAGCGYGGQYGSAECYTQGQ